MRITDFGSFSFGATGVGVEVTEPAIQQTDSALVRIAGASGAFDAFGSTQSPKAAGQVTVRFFVQESGATDVDDQMDSFLQYANSGAQWLKAIMRDGSTRQTYAKCINIEMPRQSETLFHLPVVAVFELAEPYWYSATQTTANHTVSATPTACDLTNSGTAKLVKAVLRFTGTANRPKFLNNTNGYSIELNRNISSSAVVEINLALQTVTYAGADDWANVVIPATQIGLFEFAVGANDIDFIAAGGGTPSGTVTYIYRTMYH